MASSILHLRLPFQQTHNEPKAALSAPKVIIGQSALQNLACVIVIKLQDETSALGWH
jgi:hypothetical protein